MAAIKDLTVVSLSSCGRRGSEDHFQPLSLFSVKLIAYYFNREYKIEAIKEDFHDYLT